MMRLIKAVLIGVAMITIYGCNNGETRSVEVDGHIFHIPKDYLIEGILPWLPLSQSEGLKFIINPEDRREQQILVTIEATEKTCNPKTPPVYSQLGLACAAASGGGGSSRTPFNAMIEKVNHNGNPTQWYYRLKSKGDGGKEVMIASCFAMSDDGQSGLCTAINNYEDLIYSVGFRSEDIGHLADIHRKIDGLLKSWEKQ